MTIPTDVEVKPRSHRKHFLSGCLIGILSPFVLVFLVWSMGAGLIVSDPLKQVDAIVVLSGGKADRLADAVNLFNEGYSSRLIVTRGSTDELDPETQLDYEKIMPAMHLGVPQENIIVTDFTSDSTVDEAKAVLNEMQYYGWTSCIVVTDSFHSLRSKIIFSQTFRGKGITLIMHAVPNDWYRRSNWWTTEEGRSVAASEWVKLIAYFIGIR
jgi:uncharacterized SAM-binding protein YcdF (DUF218 family)